MDIEEIWSESDEWIQVAQGRQWHSLTYTVMNLQVPEEAWCFLTSIATISFSRSWRYLASYIGKENKLSEKLHSACLFSYNVSFCSGV
jgi:hypothetical protein